MPTFTYRARDARGLPADGVATAGGADALAAELRGRGLLVLRIEPQAGEASRTATVTPDPRTWLPATRFDVEIGLQQLAAMVGSGLTLLGALRTAADQARRPRAAGVWRDVALRIESGDAMSGALEAHPRLFSRYVVQLVRVGESAGELDAMLGRSAEHLEKSRTLRAMLINALTYPAIVLAMAIGVASFMVVSVIPKIQQFLASAGRRLPPLTQNLIDFSAWMRAYLPHLGIGLAVLVIALLLVRRWPPGRLALDALTLRWPVVGVVVRTAGTAVFARGLSVLLESGVGLLEGLRGVEQLLGNEAQGRRVALTRDAVTRGESLAGALGGRREFPPMVSRMVAVGEATGTLAGTLAGLARYHEEQMVVIIRRLSMLVEPVMILVVGGIVGFVYTAFFVAIFSLASSAGR